MIKEGLDDSLGKRIKSRDSVYIEKSPDYGFASAGESGRENMPALRLG